MMRETFRQWMYPKDLRIAAPTAGLQVLVGALIRVIDDQSRQLTDNAAERRTRDSMDANALAQLGTHLWRLRNKLLEPGLSDAKPEFGRAYRHFDAAWDALADAGIQIVDPTGRAFDEGQALKAIAFQSIGGIDRDTVVQTIKPTIFFRNERIQIGEVVVGTPDRR
jgi:hypothetical protein